MLQRFFLYANRLVTAYHAYGNTIVCTIKGEYINSWESAWLDCDIEPGVLKKLGIMIIPKWDKFRLDWVLDERKLNYIPL